MSANNRVRIAFGISAAMHLLAAGLFVLICMLAPNINPSQEESVSTVLPSNEIPIAFSLSFDRPLPPRLDAAVQKAEPLKETVRAPQPAIEKSDISPRSPVEATLPPKPRTVGTESPQQPIQSAGAVDHPLHRRMLGGSIVYVLDSSGSMGIGTGSKLSQAARMLKASLRQLGPDVRFQIVTYQREAHVFHLPGRADSWLQPSVETLKAVDNRLDELIGEGISNHAEGLAVALQMQPDLLIWITDAPELTSNAIQLLSDRNRKPTRVHAIGLGDKAEGNPETRSWLGKTGGAVHVIGRGMTR